MNRSLWAILMIAMLSASSLFSPGHATPSGDDGKSKKAPPTAEAKNKKGTPAGTRPISRDTVKELRGLVERTKRARGLEGTANAAQEKVGVAEPVLKYLASQASARKLRLVSTAEVLEAAVDELTPLHHWGATESAFDRPKTLEAIVIPKWTERPPLLTCDANIDGRIPEKWSTKLSQDGTKKSIRATLQAVGLISYRDFEGGDVPLGTGWVVAAGILMTNRHVAVEFAPDGKIMTNPVSGEAVGVTINFARESCPGDDQIFRVTEVLHIVPSPGPDVALLRVETTNADKQPLPAPLRVASTRPAAGLADKDVFVAGYPFQDPRNPDDVQRAMFANIFGIKRCAPGAMLAASGEGDTEMLFHDCSTLGGNSGSPVVALTADDTPLVWGIHFQGTYRDRNWAWPLWKVVAVPEVKKLLEP